MALTITFQKTGRYKIYHTGQSIGIMGSAPPTYWTDSLITLDPTLSVNGINSETLPDTFGGSTIDWHKCGSWARLSPDPKDIPSTSNVIYSALQWNSGSNASDAVVDTTTVTFTDAKKSKHYFSKGDPDFYFLGSTGGGTKGRGIVTTTIVKDAGFGDYSLEGLPIPNYDPNLGIGWSLFVVFEHPSFEYSSVTYYAGYWDYTRDLILSGFKTPTAGKFTTRFFITAVNGNGDYAAEIVKFNGKDVSGPNNPYNNFFCGQVNDYHGFLSTVGSFGSRCAPPPTKPIKAKACFDLTNVDISNAIKNGDTTLTISYIPGIEWQFTNAIGLQVALNSAKLELTKTVDKKVTTSPDTLNYSIFIFNNGSATALTPTFYDTIPKNTTFVNNSVFIDSQNILGSPETGITLPNISGFTGITVSFKVLINSNVPVGTTIPNESLSSYSFIPLEGDITVYESSPSNEVITTIFEDPTSVSKAVDRSFIMTGNTVTYTIVLKNIPSILPLDNVVFIDTLPPLATYVTNSLTLNGQNLSASTLLPSVSLGSLAPNSINTLTFNATTSASSGDIINSGEFSYNLIVDGTTISKIKDTNTVVTTIITPNPIVKKYVDKLYVDHSDYLTYTITIENAGNVDFVDTLFKDTIPVGTTFVPNSILVDGLTVSGDIQTGIILPLIKVNSTMTVQFKVYVL